MPFYEPVTRTHRKWSQTIFSHCSIDENLKNACLFFAIFLNEKIVRSKWEKLSLYGKMVKIGAAFFYLDQANDVENFNILANSMKIILLLSLLFPLLIRFSGKWFQEYGNLYDWWCSKRLFLMQRTKSLIRFIERAQCLGRGKSWRLRFLFRRDFGTS